MPGGDGTGRLGRGKNCSKEAKAGRAGGRRTPRLRRRHRNRGS